MATLSVTLPMTKEVTDHITEHHTKNMQLFSDEYKKPFLILRVNDTKQGIISAKGSMKAQGVIIDTDTLDAIMMTKGEVRMQLIKGLRAELKANAKKV